MTTTLFYCLFGVVLVTLYCGIDVRANECADLDSQCAGWAAATGTGLKSELIYGCQANPNYMLTNCAWSCSQCRCGNTDPRCDSWAADNQCSVNPTYMSVYCRQACNMCSVNEPRVIEKIVEKIVTPTVEVTTEASVE